MKWPGQLRSYLAISMNNDNVLTDMHLCVLRPYPYRSIKLFSHHKILLTLSFCVRISFCNWTVRRLTISLTVPEHRSTSNL